MIDLRKRADAFAWDTATGNWVPFARKPKSTIETIWYYECVAPGWDVWIPKICPPNYEEENTSDFDIAFPKPNWTVHPDQELIQLLNQYKEKYADRFCYRAHENQFEWLESILLSSPHIQIPKSWKRHLRTPGPGGKDRFYVEAAIVLAAIVSWYRPGRDGNKRYAADLPWLSYKYLSDDLGLTVEVIRNAAAYLEDRGLIRRVLIDFMGDKTFLANVLHFELYLDALEAITKPDAE